MAMAYRKKPVVVEAVQWTGENHAEMCEFIDPEAFEIIPRIGLVIHTLEGDHHASPGDYIIKGVNGEFYPCKPDIFAKTYESSTLTPPNEWVSVEDNVPDPGERVLATDGIFVGEAYRTSADSWHRHTGFPWRDGVTGRTVKYWMLLPAPPGKDNNVPAKAPNEPLTIELKDKLCYGGADLSTSWDMTAFARFFPPQPGLGRADWLLGQVLHDIQAMPTLTPPNEPLTCGLVDRHGMPLRAGDTVAADKFFVYAVRYGSHNVNPDNCAPAYQVGWYLEIVWAYQGFEDGVGRTEPLYDIDGVASRYPAHCADTTDGINNLKLKKVTRRPPEGET